MTQFFHILDLIGVAVFAISGALVASRKEMDPIGFALMATVTAIGGGTLRDLILDRPIGWLADQSYLLVTMGVAAAVYFGAHLIQRRYIVLLWVDAVGLAAYGVLGAHLAQKYGVSPLPAVVLGMMTATFGGLIRDVLGGEVPLILRSEIYATAAVVAGAMHVALTGLGLDTPVAASIALAAGFAVRAGAIARGWTLPRYRPRPGREY